jgi:hypothetical protein
MKASISALLLTVGLAGLPAIGCGGGSSYSEASVAPWLQSQAGPVAIVVEGAWRIADWGGSTAQPDIWGFNGGVPTPFPPVVLLGQTGLLGGNWEDSPLRGAQNGGHLIFVVLTDGVVGYTAHLDVLGDGRTATGWMCDGFVQAPTGDCDSFTMTR